VNSRQGLLEVVKQASEVRWVGVDVEHSRDAAYYGLVCLIQLTLYRENNDEYRTYLIDTLALAKDQIRSTLGTHVFENEQIVKVLHGCLSSDVWWLARDFGIRINKVFDT